MSIRREFRIRSLQFLYAQHISEIDLYQIEKIMLKSIENLHNLYTSFLCLILVIRNNIIDLLKKKNNDNLLLKKFVNNSILKILSDNKYLMIIYNSSNNLWKKENNLILSLLKDLKNINNNNELNNNLFSFEEDKKFIIKYYKNNIINNLKLKEYVEDLFINGIENNYIAHNMVCKTLQFIKNSINPNFKLYNIYNNIENKKFIINLYRNTIIHKKEFNNLISRTSNNWDIKRMGVIDLIILQMATCEFLYFPNIPPRATMNEYIEITKIFCMKKSKAFINGILDQIYKFLYKEKKISKY
ncbi:transcription antitermination factor NusB [Blattabacterium cuenoti]|uniref:transcription antitermination factor NusB n=1 Tax=Blattabacterium cuenoti TaxID=1653831 RepID=UPI00163B956F|nr:transcription antitermination factor NusB [Blattabacterium cuenoti]